MPDVTASTEERWRSPALRQRSAYVPRRRVERWMVPLLGEAVGRRLRDCAALAPGGCLDVGCGSQPFRADIERLGFEYTGFDVHQNVEGTVEVLGAIDAPLPEELLRRGPFRVILCTEVLEHVARWPEAFANLARLLAPGGRLLVTVPHLWLPHEEPSDFHRPTSWALDFHARHANLIPMEIERLGDGYDVLGTVLAMTRVRTPRGRPWAWPLGVPFALARRLALVLLHFRALRAVVALETPLYLNTVAVIGKPATSPRP